MENYIKIVLQIQNSASLTAVTAGILYRTQLLDLTIYEIALQSGNPTQYQAIFGNVYDRSDK